MRKKSVIAFLLFLSLAVLACKIDADLVSTAMSEKDLVNTKVAEKLTEVAGTVSAGVETALGTLPSGGLPEETPTVGIAPADTPIPTAALPHLRVTFISGESPWLVEPPGSAYQLSTLTGVTSVDISDDGQIVAYIVHTGDAPSELRAVNYDGSGDRTLLSPAQVGALESLPAEASYLDLHNVKWIPGTHRLLINTRAQFMGPGLARFDDLFMLDVDSGTLTAVFTAGNAGEVWPSPDGTKMAISRENYLSMSNIDGSGMHAGVITFPVITTSSEFLYYPPVVWAADSSRFGVIIPSPDPFTPPFTGAIWSVDASTGAASLLSTLDGKFYQPDGVLSPTLDRVGYVRPTADPSVDASYISALDGSGALHLGDGTTGVDSFSPDGQYFAYYVGSPTAKNIGSLGGGMVMVPGGAMRLKWYNNTHFIYTSGTMSSWTLKMGDTGGGSTIIATPSGDPTTFDVDE